MTASKAQRWTWGDCHVRASACECGFAHILPQGRQLARRVVHERSHTARDCAQGERGRGEGRWVEEERDRLRAGSSPSGQAIRRRARASAWHHKGAGWLGVCSQAPCCNVSFERVGLKPCAPALLSFERAPRARAADSDCPSEYTRHPLNATVPIETPIPVAFAIEPMDFAGALADAFYDKPSERMITAGIVGSAGKTTVAWLLRAIFEQARATILPRRVAEGSVPGRAAGAEGGGGGSSGEASLGRNGRDGGGGDGVGEPMLTLGAAGAAHNTKIWRLRGRV